MRPPYICLILLLILASPVGFADGPLAVTDLKGAPAKADEQAKVNAALLELQRHLTSPAPSRSGGAEPAKNILQLLGDEFLSLRKNLEEIRKQQEEKKKFIEELEKDL